MKLILNTVLFRFFLVLLFWINFIAVSFSQSFYGEIKDRETNEALPFVNITLNGGRGTISDINGTFTIQSLTNDEIISFSCIGYQKLQIALDTCKNGQSIYMSPQAISLQEISVTPGENPATKIMRQVVDNSSLHNPKNYLPFSCIIYHKMVIEYDLPQNLSDINLPSLIPNASISSDSYLMLFESISEKKHLNQDNEKETVISGRVSGLKDPKLASFPALIQPFSFYNKYINLLEFTYLNPVSKPGLDHYNFSIKDTLINTTGDTLFYISYQPKADKNFHGLNGSFHINGNDFSINTAIANTAINNQGVQLSIKQNYQKDNNSDLWFPLQLESTLHFGESVKNKNSPFPLIGIGKSYVTAINTSPTFEPKEFDNITFEDKSNEKDAPVISNYRYLPLSAKDSLTYHILDSLGKRHYMDAMINTQLAVAKGKLPMGKLQLDLNRLLDYNDFEGFKAGLGIYTSPKLSETFKTGGYIAYGFTDKSYKYGFMGALMPFKNKENQLYFSHKNDVIASGSVTFMDGINKRSAELFGRFMTENMEAVKSNIMGSEFRFLKYFKSGLYYKWADVSPQKVYRFSSSSETDQSFQQNEYGLKLKWQHKETFSDSPLGKISNGSKWPKVWINGTYGETDHQATYQRIDAQVEQTFNYPSAMQTRIRLTGGQLWGTYNNTLLYSALGTYKSFTIFVPHTFATMRVNEFAADQYTACFLSHDIPLFQNKNQSFKPHVEFNTNMAFGQAPRGINSLQKGYYESGIYFRNLMSNLLFRYGFSIHYRYGHYSLSKEIDNWAFKLGLEFGF